MYCSLFSAIIGAITGGIIGIVAAYFSGRWSRATALEAIRINEFNKAAAAFCTAFVDTKRRLRQNAEDGKELIFRIITPDVFDTQEKAKILFEPCFDKFNLEALNNSWEEYIKCSFTNHTSDDFIFKNSDEERKDKSRFCLKHLENLLLYAKTKP